MTYWLTFPLEYSDSVRIIYGGVDANNLLAHLVAAKALMRLREFKLNYLSTNVSYFV